MEKLSRKKLIESIMASHWQLQRCIATSRDSFLAQFKLSRPQMELLFAVKHAPLSTKDLAQQFGVSSSAVSQMVDQLETRKLVKRSHPESDRRVTLIELNRSARELFNKNKQQFIGHLESRFHDVSDHELSQLETAMQKIIRQVDLS